jgi:nucleoid-associated protein YgaU
MSAHELDNRLMHSVCYRLIVPVLCCAVLGAAQAHAQDVAEAARQARERKAAQENSPHHVYTDDELQRAKILTPDDRSRAIAARTAPAELQKQETTQPQQAEQSAQAPTPSLGEVARAYRQEKAARHAEQLAKETGRSHYPMELPAATLAAPKPEVGPVAGSLRRDELLAGRPLPVAPVAGGNLRVSPFVPRRAVVPTVPSLAPPLASMVHLLRREKVQPGDSWWKLARRYLGDGSRWAELVRVNPGLDANPNQLRSGIFVFVPESLRTGKAPSGPDLVVRQGDTLWSLAREHLGSGNAWPQLAAANPEITQFHQLQIGTRLRLPAAPAPPSSRKAFATARN